MSIQQLREVAGERLEFFAPASAEKLDVLKHGFSQFPLAGYVELLSESNGIGETFVNGESKFVHNMLLFTVEDSIGYSRKFGQAFFVLGAPGVDGILYGIRPQDPKVYGWLPIDEEFTEVATSVQDLLKKWLSNELLI